MPLLSQSGVDPAEHSDTFGWALASNDINGDSYDDLVVGVPGESIESKTRAGAVEVLFGSSASVDRSQAQFLYQGKDGKLGEAAPGEQFGFALLATRTSPDAVSELIVGTPYEGSGAPDEEGAVEMGMATHYEGTAAGAEDDYGATFRGGGYFSTSEDSDGEHYDHFGMVFPSLPGVNRNQ